MRQRNARSKSRSNKRTKSGSGFSFAQIDPTLAKIQFWILIVTVSIVPLVVLPDSNFLDITSNPKTTILRFLGVLQAGVLLSRLALVFASNEQSKLVDSLRVIRSNRPAFAILGSIAAVTAVSIVSASLSILPAQSWWGRVPAGFEAGEFTALMYVVMSVSAFISIREINGKVTLWRTLAVVGFLASLVGLFQYLGWSPLDISSTHNSKLTGTNGNPIFYGAMLVALAPITLAVLISEHQSSSVSSRKWFLAAIGVSAFLISLSLVATASRGAWVGAFSGGVTAIVIVLIYRQLRPYLIPLIAITAFAVLAGFVATFVDPTPPEQADTPKSRAKEAAKGTINVSSALGDIGRTSTLDLRRRYWDLSADMAVTRDTVPYTNDMPRAVRWLFGYGPDMYRYAGTYFAESTTFTRRLTAAHNDPINRLAEQGFLGFGAWMTLWLSIAYGLLILIRRRVRSHSSAAIWIAIALAAALAGRFAEQLFGSPTPGGVLVFWVIVGGLAALLMKPVEQPNIAPTSATVSQGRKYAAYTSILIISLGSIILAWDRGANYLIANQIASFQHRDTVIPYEDAINRLERVTKIAPDVPRYWNDLATIEHNRADSSLNPQVIAEARSQAYEYDLKGYAANPLEVSSIYKLAFSAWEAGNNGRPELKLEALRLYERLTEIIPSDELARERLQTLREALKQ